VALGLEEGDAPAESIFAKLTAHSRLFEATERHTEIGISNAVDLHSQNEHVV
jgi:hypothetical protein